MLRGATCLSFQQAPLLCSHLGRGGESWGFVLALEGSPPTYLSHHPLKILIRFTVGFYGLPLPASQLQWSFLFKGAVEFTRGC